MEGSTENQTPTFSALPRIGDPAPQFTAETTFGNLKLEDFEGTWLILFSHPADFTPVCTTEFIAFVEIHPELRAMNCELMGLSVDSVYSHIAWVRNVKEKMGVEITFPIIADLNKDVATLYGMVNPGESKTETSRAVFIIDDKQIVRAIIYYPLTTGRNMKEILRVVQALQTTDKNGVATPANWEPGDQVIMPPPKTAEDAQARAEDEEFDCKDWYFCKKDL